VGPDAARRRGVETKLSSVQPRANKETGAQPSHGPPPQCSRSLGATGGPAAHLPLLRMSTRAVPSRSPQQDCGHGRKDGTTKELGTERSRPLILRYAWGCMSTRFEIQREKRGWVGLGGCGWVLGPPNDPSIHVETPRVPLKKIEAPSPFAREARGGPKKGARACQSSFNKIREPRNKRHRRILRSQAVGSLTTKPHFDGQHGLYVPSLSTSEVQGDPR